MADPTTNVPAPKPLEGVVRLRPGDVVMLLRARFYAGADGWLLADAVRMVAMVAMMALARIGCRQILKIRLSGFRPGGEDVMIVESRGVVRTIPVVPAIGAAVERYLAVRPATDLDLLFVTKTGGPIHIGFFAKSFGNLSRHLGAGRSVKAMLRVFCTETLHPDDPDDEIVVEHFLHGARDAEQVSINRMRGLLERCDRFGGRLARAIGNDAFAVSLAREYGTDLPDALITRPSQAGTPKTPWLGTDHPLVAKLSGVERPGNRYACAAQAEELLMETGEELAKLIASGLMSKKQAAGLYGLSRSGFDCVFGLIGLDADQRAERKAQRKETRRAKKPPTPKRRRARSTEDDRSFIAEMNKLDMSGGATGTATADQAIRRHFPQAAEMMDRGVLKRAEVAAMFGIQRARVSALRMAIPPDEGRSRASTTARQIRHAAARDIVLNGGIREGETCRERHRRLKDEHDFPYSLTAMLAIEKFGISAGT